MILSSNVVNSLNGLLLSTITLKEYREETMQTIRRERFKVVPFTLREWQIVKDNFLSNDLKELRLACSTLLLWKARHGNQTPIVIEVSELILRVIVMNMETSQDNWFAMGNLKLVYGSVIIRFINYVNEMCQTSKKDSLLSIVDAVKKVGINANMVQVRHQAAHQHLPALSVMQDTIESCRQWLWENHWNKSVSDALWNSPMDKTDVQDGSDQVAELLMAYKTVDDFVNWRAKNRAKTPTKIQVDTTPALKNLNQAVMDFPNELITAVIDHPSFVTMNWNEANADFIFDDVEIPVWDVPTELQTFWQPFFAILFNQRKLVKLLIAITNGIAKVDTVHCVRIQLAGWANKLLEAVVGSDFEVADLEWKALAKSMIQEPDSFKFAYIEKVIDKVGTDIDDGQAQALKELVVISKNPTTDSSENPWFFAQDTQEPSTSTAVPPAAFVLTDDGGIKTIEDLKKLEAMKAANDASPKPGMKRKGDEPDYEPIDGRSSANRTSEPDDRNGNGWHDSNEDFSHTPLGLMPYQTSESLYLYITKEET